jgi:hypothetical protein
MYLIVSVRSIVE